MFLNKLTSWYLRSYASIAGQVPVMPTTKSNLDFDWDAIDSDPSFQWHPCFEDFRCARLQLPMDWQGNSTEKDRSVEIAVIKLEATVPVTHDTYGGAVVLNPGGPGGSGVQLALTDARYIRTMLSAGSDADNSTAKNFDIISFDPRGVNNSRPIFTCFPNHVAATRYAVEQNSYGWTDTSEIAFDNLWALKRAFGQGCSERGLDEGFAKHVSTAPVTRDIIEIFERHGEWRESEALRLLSSMTSLESSDRAIIRERTAYLPGQEMVQYWGFSYGTLLGATLAAMFPERVKRLVLDGVVDAFDYMKTGWRNNLRTTDKLIDLLPEYCYKGGPTNCALYDHRGPGAIKETILRTASEFRQNPISVPGNETYGPTIVTFNDFQRLVVFKGIYNPLKKFPQMAKILAELGNGQGTLLATLKRNETSNTPEGLNAACQEDGPYSAACMKPLWSHDTDWSVIMAILCSDGLPRNDDKIQYGIYADELSRASKILGSFWGTIAMPCTAWKARPAWRYSGDFRSATANPILFVGNTADPVTPLHNAFLMAKAFDGSGVLEQFSEGHCSTASPSLCSGKAIRKYFQTGDLPGKHEEKMDWSGKFATCEPNHIPFDGYDDLTYAALPEGETDSELWTAMVALNHDFP